MQLVAILRRLSSGDLSDFGAPQLTASVAGRLRAEQIGVILHYLPWMMLANACNALVLVLALWTSPDRNRALIWASGVILYSSFYGLRSLRRRPARLRTVTERTVQRATRNACLLGSIWAVLPLQFFERASTGGQLIITCLCAGMLGGGAFAFATLPIAAIAFSAPLFIASAIAIARVQDQTYSLLAVLMVVYTCIILRGVFVHSLRLTRQLVEQIKVEEDVRKDPLTNLANRVSFQEKLAEAFSRAISMNKPFALLYLDIDDFKSVNDKLGHAAGDELLVQVADRLRSLQGTGDTIARFGGDEFAWIAAEAQLPEQALAMAEGIVREFEAPFAIDGQQIWSAVSVGIAIAPTDGVDSTSLVKHADIALYQAKRRRGGSVQLFEQSHDAQARERRLIEYDLRQALAAQQFHLVFQPLLDIANDRVIGCEALLRWRHPTRGVLAPNEFIAIAEETGLIHAIGEWVIREACRIAAAWPHDTKLAVNVSPAQLRRASILSVIVNALADSRMNPSRLEIEITESLMIAENEIALATIKGLRELGIKVALDDFGAGYASLTHLCKLPFDRIKIDRSFICGLPEERDHAAIVRSAISLAADLGMSVTAEGVETEAQLSWLRALNCAEAQGFLISTPISAAEVAALFWKGFESTAQAV